MSEEKNVSRECIFNIYAAEAQGFYKLIITVASSFLGGSLIFAEKIITYKTLYSLIFLGLGWLFLICGIALVITIRGNNLNSALCVLRGNNQQAEKIDNANDKDTKCLIRILILGISMIMLSGAIEIFTKYFRGA